MVILTLDTTGDYCRVGLQKDGQIFQKSIPAKRRQVEMVFPLLDELFQSAAVDRKDLKFITVPIGPGSFTGVRLGAAIAQAIATALDLKTITISSLKALAATAFRLSRRTNIVVASDARGGEIYFAAYRFVHQLEEVETVIEDELVAPAKISLPDYQDWAKAGSGWNAHMGKYRPDFNGCFDSRVSNAETADILSLAEIEIRRGRYFNASDISPVYLRHPVK